MKRAREQEEVSLALSLSTTTTDSSSTTASDSAGSPPAPSPAPAKRARRRGPLVATSGEGDFVCKTCGRAFTSFQALGGHRTSHLRGRGRHGLELGVGAKALRQHKAADGKHLQQHECQICGQGFEMEQALGGHMRRHREETGAAEARDAWVWRPQELLEVRRDPPPVLLELFA